MSGGSANPQRVEVRCESRIPDHETEGRACAQVLPFLSLSSRVQFDRGKMGRNDGSTHVQQGERKDGEEKIFPISRRSGRAELCEAVGCLRRHISDVRSACLQYGHGCIRPVRGGHPVQLRNSVDRPGKPGCRHGFDPRGTVHLLARGQAAVLDLCRDQDAATEMTRSFLPVTCKSAIRLISMK
jgi:hypothetical protein